MLRQKREGAHGQRYELKAVFQRERDGKARARWSVPRSSHVDVDHEFVCICCPCVLRHCWYDSWCYRLTRAAAATGCKRPIAAVSDSDGLVRLVVHRNQCIGPHTNMIDRHPPAAEAEADARPPQLGKCRR